MSQTEKAHYFRVLKEAGVPFDRHYREYKTEELKQAYDLLLEQQPELAGEPPAEPAPSLPLPPLGGFDPAAVDPEAAAFYGFQPPPQTPTEVPVRAADPNELAGQRLNSQPKDQPIRVDEYGREWFQEEILKPAFPKPRGRRVLTYMESGVKQKTVSNGNYQETFEVAGDEAARPAEVKITLPSYQVGIFKDPRFPFKVHTYNGLEGFDLFEVQEYYHGAELVPPSIKRIYVENVLCYDIRTVVRAIEDEYRQLQLMGKVQ